MSDSASPSVAGVVAFANAEQGRINHDFAICWLSAAMLAIDIKYRGEWYAGQTR